VSGITEGDAPKHFPSKSFASGQGYTVAGDASMPDWSKPAGSVMTGNTGHGHARITLLN
jgi:hypothetical protein